MQANGTAKEVSIEKILTVLRKRRAYLLTTLLLVTSATAIYAFSQADRFRAEALLAAEPSVVPNYIKHDAPAVPVNMQERLWLIRERLFNPMVLETVIREFHLDSNAPPEGFLEKTWVQGKHWLMEAARILPFYRTEEITEEERRQLQIEAIKSRIAIQVEAADAFAIGFEGKTREQTMDVTNRLADLLVQGASAVSEQNASWAAGFLKTEVEQVKAKLDQQNERIRLYQQRAPDELPERLATELKFLETLQAQLHAKTEQISDDQARRAAVLQEMKDLEEQGALEAAANSPAETRLEEQRTRLKQLQATYTDQYPEIRSIQTEIQNLEKTVAASKSADGKVRGEATPARLRYVALRAESEEIDQRLGSYRKQEKKLSDEIANYERKVNSAPQRERTLAELVRDYEITRAEYQSLLEKQNQAQLNERLSRVNQSSDFRIVRNAILPLKPYAPQRARIILMGLFAGLALGTGLVVFAEARDTTYHSAEEFRDSTNLPVLTVIPSLPMSSNGRHLSGTRSDALSLGTRSLKNPGVVALSDPRCIASEQYGILAMQVRQRLGRESCKVIAVTSAAGGEGKTITSLNLSLVLSRTMEGRVLLLESDLRRPRLQEYIHFRQPKGFSDLLREPNDPIEPYLLRINGLSILRGGPVLEDPLRLLASHQTPAVFSRLRQQFDLIVVDTPPILPIADTQVLSGLSDGVILVVRARQTRRELLEHALRSFRVSNLLGVVLNGVDLQRSSYYYAYDYYANQYLAGEKQKKGLRP